VLPRLKNFSVVPRGVGYSRSHPYFRHSSTKRTFCTTVDLCELKQRKCCPRFRPRPRRNRGTTQATANPLLPTGRLGTQWPLTCLPYMLENPCCPACGQTMIVRRQTEVPGEEPDVVFECPACHVVYLSKDHEPVTGRIGERQFIACRRWELKSLCRGALQSTARWN
jgi:predicted RNA-binding Zn-ribbon protein involved in translation (DUF1610 family)